MYGPTIIGHTDRLGYLRCLECHEAREIVSDHPIYSDERFPEPCDCCAKPVGGERT